MNSIKNIFGRLWALWALIWFVITFIIAFLFLLISYLLPEKKGHVFFLRIARIWMNIWLFIIQCPVKIHGRQHFAAGKTYVVVFNHNAFLDVCLSAPYTPGINKTIAKKSFTKIPLFGLFYKKGSVLVDRKSETSRSKSFEAMKRTLHSGMHMCIYPEGTRNRTSSPLKSFYDGAFKLAIATKKDIIPCVINGTKKAMPINKKFFLLPTRLKMHFLPAISSDNISATALKEKTYAIMNEFYINNIS